ncbi:hypothetical protein TNIN_90141 [Trichonephila inaurata madagascariensis]|uniref:Uncharacterized protein n=1 Tax=Trichonephila inaurata madagascariensis TaxID=2747483 RepID=A0A8X6YBS8_9ARAC|nr:hypothetical protein TNIN_90141 [Trichonephila inaurata madagascariensis]
MWDRNLHLHDKEVMGTNKFSELGASRVGKGTEPRFRFTIGIHRPDESVYGHFTQTWGSEEVHSLLSLVFSSTFETAQAILTFNGLMVISKALKQRFNSVMDVTINQTAYADSVDNARILRAERTAEANCKEAKTVHRAFKAAKNNDVKETEGLLYAPLIAD